MITMSKKKKKKVTKIRTKYYRVPEILALAGGGRWSPGEVDEASFRYMRGMKQFVADPDLPMVADILDLENAKPYPRGGATSVSITAVHNNKEQTVMGVAICSMRDPFCYNRGRQIAIGRAVKELEADGEYEIAWEPKKK
jgi:hypothetical protein